MSPEGHSRPLRVRREPPPFRPVTVLGTEPVTPRLMRVTLGGPELDGLRVDDPAASVRLLLPSPRTTDLVVPAWTGNEFLLPDGQRPTIRTFTPRRVDPEARQLEVEIVVHGGGVASDWATTAESGAVAAVSGPGRGYAVDDGAAAFVLAGDETALPAMCQLLEVLPAETPVQVHIEIAHPDARFALPDHPQATSEWHQLPDGGAPGDAMVGAIQGATIPSEARVWAAGEAAGVQRLRRHLFEERGLSRASASIRGYWKQGARRRQR